jgi:hypothetical protein
VDCANLIAKLRALHAEASTEAAQCAGCGRELPALPVREWLQSALDPDGTPDAAPDDDAGDAALNRAYLRLCPVCRRRVYAANNAAG